MVIVKMLNKFFYLFYIPHITDKNINKVYLPIIFYYPFFLNKRNGIEHNDVSLYLDYYFKSHNNLTIISYYYSYLIIYYFPSSIVTNIDFNCKINHKKYF